MRILVPLQLIYPVVGLSDVRKVLRCFSHALYNVYSYVVDINLTNNNYSEHKSNMIVYV